MKNKVPFICPYCKEESGWMKMEPVKGRYNTIYDKFGEEEEGDYEITTFYKAKYFCINCDKGITKAVTKYLGLDKEKD